MIPIQFRSASRRLPLGLLLIVFLACHETVESEGQSGAWQVIDLTKAPPAFVHAPGQRSDLPYQTIEAHLGAEEVRDLDRVPRSELKRVPKLSAGLVSALRQHSGSRLRWDLPLGTEAYFSFVPLVIGEEAAPSVFRVTVIDSSGGITNLLRHRQEPTSGVAPETIIVDLSAWQDSTAKLLLEIEVEHVDDTTPLGNWGSPFVAYRQERVPTLESKRPSLLLLGVDTLRADHLGAWGRAPSLTPALDALAGESDVWLEAFSCFNVTNPSFASILTGLYGKNHGVYDFQTPLAEANVTLAEILLQEGYSTRAILSARHLQGGTSGLGQGFQEMLVPTDQRSGEMAVTEALDWIARQEKPFFLWLHLFDPHTPHTPPQPYASGMRPSGPSGLSPTHEWTPFRTPGASIIKDQVLGGSRDLYEGEVAYLDRQIDRILGFMRSHGLLENTIVVLIADHGENLEEHGVTYRHAGLFDATTHIPLMIRWPGFHPAGRRLSGMVQNIDLFPTLVAALGAELPEVDGVDLRKLTGGEKAGRKAVFAEQAFGEGAMVRLDRWKYFEVRDIRITPKGNYLFDLKSDPGETHNLAGTGLAIEARLANLLARWESQIRSNHASEPVELDEQDLDALRALGYL